MESRRCASASVRGSRWWSRTRPPERLVPLPPRETAEGDQADQRHDQSEPEAPDDHHDDPDDDEDAAGRNPGDSSATFAFTHVLLLKCRMPCAVSAGRRT